MIDSQSLELPNFIRYYDGAFDSKTQAALDRQDQVLEKIQTVEPEALTCYFPMEEQYVVHVYGRKLSGYHSTRAQALADAYNRLFSV